MATWSKLFIAASSEDYLDRFIEEHVSLLEDICPFTTLEDLSNREKTDYALQFIQSYGPLLDVSKDSFHALVEAEESSCARAEAEEHLYFILVSNDEDTDTLWVLTGCEGKVNQRKAIGEDFTLEELLA